MKLLLYHYLESDAASCELGVSILTSFHSLGAERLLGASLPRVTPQFHCLSPKWPCGSYLMPQVLIICHRQTPRTIVKRDL